MQFALFFLTVLYTETEREREREREKGVCVIHTIYTYHLVVFSLSSLDPP